MPNDTTALTPQARYRQLIEPLAIRELAGMVGEEEARRKAARFALAYRQAATAAPAIYECSPQSVGSALAMSLLTDLPPGGPLPAVYLIPRGGELQWQVSWRGLRRLAQRSGYYLRAEPVYTGEEYEWRGVAGLPHHVPGEQADLTLDTWETLRGVYVVAHLLRDGAPGPVVGTLWMSRAKIEARRAVSDSWRAWKRDNKRRCPWVEWPEELARKTAIRYAVSRGLIDLDDIGQIAYGHDQTADLPAEPVEIESAPVAPEPPADAGARAMVRARLATLAEAESAPEPEAEPPAVEPEPEPEPLVPTPEGTAREAGAVSPECAAALDALRACDVVPHLVNHYHAHAEQWRALSEPEQGLVREALDAHARSLGLDGLAELRRRRKPARKTREPGEEG